MQQLYYLARHFQINFAKEAIFTSFRVFIDVKQLRNGAIGNGVAAVHGEVKTQLSRIELHKESMIINL